jgi:Protein of unknown function (DUF3570)
MSRALHTLALGLLLCSSVARADEASGTWTGNLEGRGNYFYERSTRVIVPNVAIEAEAPNGMRIGVDYLVDVISSASIAQTGGGDDAVFTELRHGVGLKLGKAFDVSDASLDVTVHGRYSAEDDYDSRVYGLATSLTWNDKSTTASLGVTRVDDTVLSNIDADFEGDLSGVVTSLGLSQVISPVVTASVSYQLGVLQGFLGNPYRNALIGPLPYPEAPPSDRIRHNVEGQLSWRIVESGTTLGLSYRTYADSWDVAALTPEARVYQSLGEDFVVRARYRFYAQTRAYFFRDAYPRGYIGPITSDPKMSEFESHQVGLKLAYRLSFLDDTFLGFAKDAWIDLSVDRQFCTSTFGNNVMASAGGRLPF